jgi:hypothetical protein
VASPSSAEAERARLRITVHAADTLPKQRAGTVPAVHSLVVRVWVPDRPGSLAQVAAAIGAAGCDVTAIEILERGGGHAIDEIAVLAPHPSAAQARDALLDGLRSLEGVAVEDIRERAIDHVDVSVRALDGALRVVRASEREVLRTLCDEVVGLLDGEWAAAVAEDGTEPLAACGNVPDLGWLAAFVVGSRHLATPASGAAADGVDERRPDQRAMDFTPSDVAWAPLPTHRALVVAGRSGRPIHERERASVASLAAIADARAGRR